MLASPLHAHGINICASRRLRAIEAQSSVLFYAPRVSRRIPIERNNITQFSNLRPKPNNFQYVRCGATGFGRPQQFPESAPGVNPDSPILPSPPDLGDRKPRTSWNATSLAFLGDAVWELYVRRHCFSPPTKVSTYYENVVAQVRAEQQEIYYGILHAGDFLTAEEQNVMKWGGNAKTTKPARFSKSGVHGQTYMRATALECLIGWEYLENPARLHELMCHLGLG